MRMNLAELVGTFSLVLVGPGAATIGLSHLWVSIAFGSIVTLMILCFGKISGAHINPAVSIGFYLVEKEKRYLWYIPYQLIGGLLAGILLLVLIPDNKTYGETLPNAGLTNSIWIEIFITFILMLSILVIVRSKHLVLISIVVGFVVFLAAYIAGPYTGASMNPARSFGPAIVSNQSGVLWIYFLAPTLGSALAVYFFKMLSKSETK